MGGCNTRRWGMAGTTSGAPDGNTLFLTRFSTTTPTEEVTGVAGSFAGNAFADTTTKQLVLDGTGDWMTWPSGNANASMQSRYNVTTNWTWECHTNLAGTQVGGIMSRGNAGAARWAIFCSGTSGNLAWYADAFSTGTPVVNANILDGNEHHIAVVRDGGTYRLYADGVQVSSQAWAGSPSTSDTFGVFIGTDEAGTTTRDVAGRIGRVKMSNICRYPSGTTFSPPSRTAT
jgi:hypothetical protein